MNLQEIIKDAIDTDDQFKTRNQTDLIKSYTESNKETKIIINDIFISLCGYSLETLINRLNNLKDE
jgi:hypothetical protein